jgi:hypothetical protein
MSYADLEHAVAYPFDIPHHSFAFNPLTCAPEPFDHGMVEDRQLVPVAAVGSNASPSQLGRKFPPHGALTQTIPVLYTELQDFDSVYAARVSKYGSIPATPYPSPGTVVRVHVTFLNERQLERMNRTESLGVGYDLVEMPDGCFPELPGRRVLTYVARSGALLIGEHPSALAAISGRNRAFTAISERAAIDVVAEILGFEAAGLVDAVIMDREKHAALNLQLASRGSKWP